MAITILIIGLSILLIGIGFFFLIRKHTSTKKRISRLMIGIIGGLIVITVAYAFVSKIQCNRLEKYGFYYEIRPTQSPTWDIFVFLFEDSEGKKIKGPVIAGNQLKVKCHDLDIDGVPEFVIQSKSHATHKTILEVEPSSGGYHIQYTNGLKVSYTKEGYRSD